MTRIVPSSPRSIALLTLLIAAGCNTPHSNTRSKQHDPIADGRIPSSYLLSEGSNSVGFIAPTVGLVYLYAEVEDRVLTSFTVKKGDRVDMPDATTRPTLGLVITVNGVTIFTRPQALTGGCRFYLSVE